MKFSHCITILVKESIFIEIEMISFGNVLKYQERWIAEAMIIKFEDEDNKRERNGGP